MDESLLIQVLAIVLLVVANGFFALSEFSVIASHKSKLKRLTDKGRPGARSAEKLHSRPDRFLASIQFGITLLGTLAGVFGGATLVTRFESFLTDVPINFIAQAAAPIAVTVIALGITFFSVVFGELVPKYVALSAPEKYARFVSRPMTVFVTISSSVSTVLSAVSNLVVQMLGVKNRDDRVVTEEEINLMILDGREKGVFDPIEEQLIKSVFDFADSTVRRAMTPRTDVASVDMQSSVDEIVSAISEHGYTRYPISDGSMDNIVGILHTKDVIVQRLDPNLIVLQDLCREAHFVPDSMPLPNLLKEIQIKKYHMAIVLDEFGGTAGIITLEDILEELVGEIQDEYDAEIAPLVRHSANVAFADGSVWPGAVNEMLGCNLPEEQNDSLAGLVIDTMGRMPEISESVTIKGVRISVVQTEKNRLTRLRLEKISDDDEDE